MRKRYKPGSTFKTIVPCLLAVAMAAMLMPREWTSGLMSLVQVIVPFQDASTRAATAVRGSFEEAPVPVSGDRYDELARQKEALEHQVAALSVRVEDLRDEVEVLTGTRLWEVNGQRIGATGRLIPSRVITPDLLVWHSSRLLNAGTLQGVKPGAPVMSQYFEIDHGEASGARDGLAILLREVLLGYIEQAGTHTSRARLLSDIGAERKVRIGRRTDDGFTVVDRFFWMVGLGHGRMEIRDVEYRDIEEGLIAVGDVVLSAQSDETDTAGLPAAMKIGDVTDIRTDLENPLLSILTVQSPLEAEPLSRVYIYDPDAE